ncbi:MAG: hypothetical protein CFE43_07640 [Burkholderiales bacterium PBB3]|nr:MAG: hypothetical protein CFE43_07640 [Burkholderiales bacterium PBB3]
MSLALNPYWQTFSAPWRQRKTEKAFGFLIAIAVLMSACWLLLLFITQFDRKAILTGVGVTLVFVSHVFLFLYVASAMAYNRPVCVLTVPGFLKVQRRTLMATWSVAVLVQCLGLILQREMSFARFSENNGLLLVICVACSLLGPLMLRFHGWLVVPFMTTGFWLPRLEALWPHALDSANLWPVWNAFDWALAPVLLATTAWVVSLCVLRPGDARHRASVQVLTGLQAAMRGNYWDFETKQAQSQSRLDQWLGLQAGNDWAFNSRMAAAQPTADSVLDRAELAFAPEIHWRRRLVMAAVAVVFGAFVVWFVRLGSDSVDPSLASPMLYVSAMLIGWTPFVQWHQSMQRTHREQGLLMLVPGMPSGNDLARRIARRVLQSAAVTWVLMALVLAITVQLWPGRPLFTWLAWGLALASLLSLPFVVRDWAQARPQAGPSKLLLLGLPLLAGAVALAVAMAWSDWPMALWVVLALAATLAHLAWRWRRLARMGQPLPVGRSVT